MQIIQCPEEMRKRSDQLRLEGHSIGFVPTMGALHNGHLSLVKASLKENTKTVTSIFVNPAQFGPNEDLERYPRDLDSDVKLLNEEGCDILFVSEKEQIYPEGFQTWVEVAELPQNLCGLSRPGHFKGVATVVAKLFNIVNPHQAYFGWKDAQQVLVIKKMVRDLNFSIKIKAKPTVRDSQGLALSSRNRYLSADEREIAKLIPLAIQRAKEYFQNGNKNAKLLINELVGLFDGQKNTEVEYISLVGISDLKAVDKITKDTLLALAVRVGATRLIDNHLFSEEESCSE